MRHRTLTLAVVALLAVSVLAGTGAGTVAGGQGPLAIGAQEDEAGNETADNSTVEAGTGAQLSTVIASASDDVQTEYEETTFEAEFRAGNESERARAIAHRSAELDARAEAIRAEYENATRAFENGTISKEEYAQRMAALNARAKNVRNSSERLERRTDEVPRAELEAAGLNGSEINSTLATLEAISGPGQNALLAKFTGESEAEIEVRSGDGVRIEVESEDGERSREFRRPGDASTAITIEQSVALANARTNLSTSAGSWALSDASVHEEDGEYRFEFLLANGSETGEAAVRVDGSSGEVVRVEEELERPESDVESDETDADELSLVVVDGTVAPSETITVEVRAGSEPVPNVPVTLDGDSVGETDENGTIDVTLPAAGDDARIEADDGDRDGRLELELHDDRESADGNESEDGATPTDLSFEPAYDDGTITVTVSNDGDAVEGASVDLNGDDVGETDANGTLSFDVDPDAEEYEIEVYLGDAETKSTYVLRNGSLVDAEAADNSETETPTETETATETETETATPTPSADDVDVDATLDDGTVTLTLTNDGSPIEGAALSVNSDSIGDTDANGVVSFQVESGEEDYDVRFEKDDVEIRTEYLVENGSIEQTEDVRVK